MAENEIPAAAEAPETDGMTETTAPAEDQSGRDELASGAPGEEPREAVQMTMDAADLLGDSVEPVAESETKAAELKAVLEAVVYVMN